MFDKAYFTIQHKINPLQFRNMKSASNTYCLINLLDFVLRTLKPKKKKASIVLAFINFRKVFDLFEYTAAITNSINIGLSYHLISWLADLLTQRLQAVCYQVTFTIPSPLGSKQGIRLWLLCFLMLLCLTPLIIESM